MESNVRVQQNSHNRRATALTGVGAEIARQLH
jgi:hypothetical protein